MLLLNDMTRDDVEIVEFPYPDDWYDKPEMVGLPMDNASELWLKRDHKRYLAFRLPDSALEKGVVEAIHHRLEDGGITFHLSEVKGPVMDRLKRSHFLEELTGKVHLTQYDVVSSIHPGLARCALDAQRVPPTTP